jgi:hypothetical protein
VATDRDEIIGIVQRLEAASTAHKLVFVSEFLEWFGLGARAAAREPEPTAGHILQMKGAIEIFVRCLDQMRDYRMVPKQGRPDVVFLKMLWEMGNVYGLAGEVGGALRHVGNKLESIDQVN